MFYQNNLEESNEKRIENDIITAVQEVFSNTNSSIELLENEPDQNTFYHELYFQPSKTKETKEEKEIKEIEETKEAKEPKEIKETKETKESSSNQENKIKKNIFLNISKKKGEEEENQGIILIQTNNVKRHQENSKEIISFRKIKFIFLVILFYL